MKTDFCGEPVNALFGFYLNLIMILFGNKESVRRALLRAVRSINQCVAVPKAKKRPGKKERLKRKLKKDGSFKKESEITASRLLKLERRKQKRLLKREQLRKQNAEKARKIQEASLSLKLFRLKEDLSDLIDKGKIDKSFADKHGIKLKESVVFKPCLSCACERLGLVRGYGFKHFVEKGAFCFKKKCSIEVVLAFNHLEIRPLGLSVQYVSWPKFFCFVLQYTVIPSYNSSDQGLRTKLCDNISKLLNPLFLKDRLSDLNKGWAMCKQAIQQKNHGFLDFCYPYIVASLFSSVENVGSPIIEGLTKPLIVEKLQVPTSGSTVAETRRTKGVLSEEIKVNPNLSRGAVVKESTRVLARPEIIVAKKTIIFNKQLMVSELVTQSPLQVVLEPVAAPRGRSNKCLKSSDGKHYDFRGRCSYCKLDLEGKIVF